MNNPFLEDQFYRQALKFLGQARTVGMKLGLQNIIELAREMGNVHEKMNFIHIAGTNGKGSTAAFIASALKRSGFKTGLYTSPHLVTIRERIQINGHPISKEQFSHWVLEIQEKIERIKQRKKDFACTFFEIITMVAILEFFRCKVDWVVWETGLGGRLDATNIVNPRLSIITNIDYDHTQFLGDTLESIAEEKAGIIKEGVPVIVGKMPKEALAVIKKRALEKGAELIDICQSVEIKPLKMDYERQWVEIANIPFCLGLTGIHQLDNAACAFAALRLLFAEENSMDIKRMQEGFRTVCWPGRFQVIRKAPLCIIDGAHNVAATKQLVANWEQIVGDEPYHLVFGVLQDKNFPMMAEILKRKASMVTLIKPPTSRGLEPKELLPFFGGIKTQICPSWADFMPSMDGSLRPILATGSLYLIGQILVEEYEGKEEFKWNELLDG
ncbi:bifunctional folylpolyglutamate synthase/dihydrofolate synthase [Candidatus Methylacidiphilum fumarolicum]|uniref:Dihydrofolate synthase/folylpolyglutamate synthase n=2 Tax=Candidatus Methylacidiphilum fumarolicum TaxID=591154 RepID=I0JXU2_METFB|nr:Mur ligase family protein [Candidatus Methylacidiphilum fumarolicum]MBW6414229.1 bifunctional folylpolyglutamate synthase/dihydrofolate synthase [Candidatus Methylacidiphilum fumarolicum]TFE69937.1 bifunctional folylpolyglutamate synthase/dihydrofolate synthase [Candidatus Methylacidiphilum fumarolicum]TFE73741.1 bifunctional folylpolyglutamate synthase/dihydrofolate synthase [Candidatus Methylacidiphilum fumarolicum]TFE75653.1 bifunctional folylpolyglutamate synthase/dihydrofolate synthase 